jgi:endonuclease/exonuclease/phosphatase family metal-dependent hydrolase
MTRGHALTRTLAALTGLVGLAVPAIASASSSSVGPPTGVRVVHVSPRSFTVTSLRSSNARRYRVYASTKKRDLSVDVISSDRMSADSKTPKITLKGLRYQTAPYFYRVEAINGSRRRFSTTIGSVGLRPAMPTVLAATSSAAGTYLTWRSGVATGFTVQQATDPGMTQGLRSYPIDGQETQFTPYGLVNGTTYYFRIRAMNAGTPSSYSNTVQAVAMSDEQPVRVMSYNILEACNDGRKEGGATVAPWSERGPAIAKLIDQADPDVVGIQEAASWVGKVKGPRQIDSLTSILDGAYKLADTEIPPSQPHFVRTGVYILYKTATYKAIGSGGHWNLGNTRWAAYQMLQNRATGARFLFVSAHLLHAAGVGADARRAAETKNLLSDAGRVAGSAGVPAVYVGDFNSDQYLRHSYNGPAITMRAAHVADAFDVAQTRTRAQYNTAENYKRTPPKNGARIDYVFAAPGVAVRSWGLVMDLAHRKFVGTIPSDHNPLVSNLLVPYSAAS